MSDGFEPQQAATIIGTEYVTQFGIREIPSAMKVPLLARNEGPMYIESTYTLTKSSDQFLVDKSYKLDKDNVAKKKPSKGDWVDEA